MPSVHGGGIQKDIGGVPEEPIFRGAPMDSGQATAAVLKAKQEGAKRVVLVATEIEGSQLQLEAAIHASKMIGLNIVDEISVGSEQPSYRAEVNRISKSNPDTMLIFSQAQDGGTIVKQSAEAGLSILKAGGNAIDAAVAIGFCNVVQEPYMASIGGMGYNIQYYDVLVVTALAIEKAGSTVASEWAKQVRKVAMGPGKKVYTYKEGIDAIRSGQQIDYSGLTGEFDYSATGTVSGLYGIFEWQNGKLVKISSVDGKAVLDNDL